MISKKLLFNKCIFLMMVNWESQSKTPPQSPEERHIHCILHIRIAFCHVSENLSLRCFFYVTMNIYFEHIELPAKLLDYFLRSNKNNINQFVFYVDTARDVVTVLLIFAKYVSLYLRIFTCTYGDTHRQAHMYNQ